jgi:hypothetical protein
MLNEIHIKQHTQVNIGSKNVLSTVGFHVVILSSVHAYYILHIIIMDTRT